MMRHVKVAAAVLSVGLVASLTACKKEKEQNGPSVTLEVFHDGTRHTSDFTLPLGTYQLVVREECKKGTGKDDADLKSYNISYSGGYSIPSKGGNAPQGAAFTVTDTIEVDALSSSTLTITVSVTDKNEKSASKSIKITFQNPPPSEIVSDTLDVSNRNNNRGTYVIYTSSDFLQARSREEAEANPGSVLFVYYYSDASNSHSVISPAILRNSIYNGTDVEWDDANTKTAEWREISGGFDAVSTKAGLQSLYDDGTPIDDEFTGNGNQRARLTVGRLLAFKWGNDIDEIRYGVIKVISVNNAEKKAQIAIKVSK